MWLILQEVFRPEITRECGRYDHSGESSQELQQATKEHKRVGA